MDTVTVMPKIISQPSDIVGVSFYLNDEYVTATENPFHKGFSITKGW